MTINESTNESNVDVSIIMPMHNAEAYVLKTLASILCEHHVKLEVIVIDDQSTDNAVNLIRNLNDARIHIISGQRQGIAAALNLGIQASKGLIIMRCDADDLYPPARIAQQFNWLKQHAEYGAVCGAFSTIDAKENHVGNMATGELEQDITLELESGITRTHLGTYAVRSSVVKSLDGFRSYFVTAEDIDFALRLPSITKVMYLPSNAYFYRLHNHSITHTQVSVQRQFYEDTARAFQAQRKATGSDDLQNNCPPVAPKATGTASGAEAQIQGMLIASAWNAHAKGHVAEALSLAWRSFKHNPRTFKYYRSVIVLIIKSVKIGS